MRAPKTILIGGVVLSVTAATATILYAQQRPGEGSRPVTTAAASASLAQRPARSLLKQGVDWLDNIKDPQTALIYLREAQRRPAGLDDGEIRSLADALDRAERAVQEAGPVQVAVVPQPRRAIGSRRDPVNAPPRDEPVQLASTEAAEPTEPPAIDLPALPGEALPPATDDAPAAVKPGAKPTAAKPAADPIFLTSSTLAEAPAQDDKAPTVPAPVDEPVDAKASVNAPADPPRDDKAPALPPLDEPQDAKIPPSADSPAPPPELPSAPIDTPAEPPAETPVPTVPKAAAPAIEERLQAPVDVKPIEDAPVDAPTPGPAQTAPVDPSTDAADELPPLPDDTKPAAPSQPLFAPNLSPESLRAIEEVARRQDEEARQNPPPMGNIITAPGGSQDSLTSPLAIQRAPSPTEPRPIRVIPVPEDFVPLPKREWEPNRKYWAAAATCHMPLYFQDAVLERYGQGVEQAIGPHGRYFSYPLDDPRQSNQRNQLLQPMYSAGMFITQMALLPYNFVMDPPWEAQYDLGYYRPGDKIPGDTYYLPKHGIGPPWRGNRY